MTADQIRTDVLQFARRAYPEIQVTVAPYPEEPDRLAITFVEERFAGLYPLQRYHYLVNLIPQEYYDEHLANTVWFELAPGEEPKDLEYPDDDLVAQITSDVMNCVEASGFFAALDDALCPADEGVEREPCRGDFRIARRVLQERGFIEDELFDVLHVMMAQGGYCDCELLYNVAEESRLAAEYWEARAAGQAPYDPHARPER